MKRKLRIIHSPECEGYGSYNPTTNTIHIARWLKKYPEYYKNVLEHELKRAEIENTGYSWGEKTWQQLELEYTDFFIKTELPFLKKPKKEKIKFEDAFSNIIVNILRIPGDLFVYWLMIGAVFSRLVSWIFSKVSR